MQRRRGRVLVYRPFTARNDGASVHALVEFHETAASGGVTHFNGALNRCRTAMPGKQRSMYVDAAVGKSLQHVERQNFSISCHHGHIGVQRLHLLRKVSAANFCRLEHGQSMGKRPLLDGRHRQLLAATFGLIGLRHDCHDLANFCTSRK